MTEVRSPVDARVVKRSLVVAGHATSVSLEEPFWTALRDLASAEGVSIAGLVARIDGQRRGANLSSALRVHVLRTLQQRAALSSRGPADATAAPAAD